MKQRNPRPSSSDDGRGSDLAPYLPRVAVDWAAVEPERRWREIDASLLFADVSGFTALSERLARRGRIGGEELTDVVSGCFTELLAVAYRRGGSLIKFGGDALLLLFDGPNHPFRAATTAIRMRQTMARVGRLTTSVGQVRLRMSLGMHSGAVHAFRVGRSHRELLLAGPAASTTVAMESAADAGEILVSAAAAALLPPDLLGATKAGAVLLRRKRVIDGDQEHQFVERRLSGELASSLPRALRDHLRHGAVEPEHRQATVAFVHFDGTDGLLRAEGPAVVATALDELMSEVQSAADAHDVTFLATDIDQDGGKIILVSGAPTAAEDDAGQMLHALRRVAAARLRLPVRIGVHRGPVFAGEVGPPYRRTYTVMGDAVNLAARLMANAAPGQILATGGVVGLARTRFVQVPIPPFTVKGKSQPVQAFALGEPVGPRSGWGEGAALSFGGRDAELRLLLERLSAAGEGRGGVVELVGESGIGKTRLIAEMRTRADWARVVETACEPYESRTPYFALRGLLAPTLGLGSVTPTVRSVERAVAGVDPRLAEWAPLAGEVFGLTMAPTPCTADLEPQFRREKLAWLVGEVMDRVFSEPTVFVFDDAHWMDDSSCAVLTALSGRLARRPWLLCAVRVEAPAGFRSADTDTANTIVVGPLDDAVADQLLVEATRGEPLPPHRRHALVARAGGNPLFLGELLAAGATESGDGDGLPATLDAVISAEIDRLPNEERRLLRNAAVLGMVFEPSVLACVVEDDLRDHVPDVASRLSGFVEPAGAERLRFRNQCARDVAYGTLPFRRRRELHARAGIAIERSAVAPEDRAEVLSLHFLHAQQYESCWRYARIAAARAESKYANLEGAELCEQALAAGGRIPVIEVDDLAGTWELLADMSTRTGAYPRARAALASARRLWAGQPVHLARLLSKEAGLAERREQGAQRARWIGRALRVLDGLSSTEAVGRRAGLRVKKAELLQDAGRHKEALRWAEQAKADAEQSGNRRALAQALWVIDWVHMSLGRPELATNARTALTIWEELGELGSQAVVLNNLGAFAYYQGRWDEALAYYLRGRDLNARIGNVVDAGVGTCNVAEILIDQGRLDEAEPTLHEVADLFRSVGYSAAAAFATRHLGRIAVKRGQLDEADRLLAGARHTFLTHGFGAKVLEVDAWRAECLLRRGDLEGALVLLNDALRREEASGDTTLRPMLHRLRAYAYAGLARPSDAWAEIDESLHVARARQAAFEVALGLEALSVLAALGGLPPDASAEDERSALLDGLGVCSTPAPPLVELRPAG